MQLQNRHKCRHFKRAGSRARPRWSDCSTCFLSCTPRTCSRSPLGSWPPLDTPRCVSPHRSSRRYRPSAPPSRDSRCRRDPVSHTKKHRWKRVNAWWTTCRTSLLAGGRRGGDALLPRGSTVLHRWWCRWTPWGHSSPPGCWCSSGGSRSCSRAPPSPVPALLPWQPAAFSAGCSTDAHHKRGWGSDTSERVKRSQDWLNRGIFSVIPHQL